MIPPWLDPREERFIVRSDRKLPALAVFLCLTALACGSGRLPQLPPGPTYTVSGQVKQAQGDPLQYASVVLSGSPLGALTDDQGRFGVDNVRSGGYGMTVLYLGFRSAPAQFRVPGTRDSTLTLDLVRDPDLGAALADSMPPVTVSFSVQRAQ